MAMGIRAAGGKGKKGRDNSQARDKQHYKTAAEKMKDDAERAGKEKGELGGGRFCFFTFSLAFITPHELSLINIRLLPHSPEVLRVPKRSTNHPR